MVITTSPSLRDESIWKPMASRQSSKRVAPSTNGFAINTVFTDSGCSAADMQSGDY